MCINSPQCGPKKTGDDLRILVVDDEDQIRAMLRQVLERAGYAVIDAPNGRVALRLFREDPADLIITDLIMPEKEGIETIRELRKEFPEVKIIAISGGGQVSPEAYLDVAEGLGAHRTFAKPIAHQELLGAVAELVGKP